MCRDAYTRLIKNTFTQFHGAQQASCGLQTTAEEHWSEEVTELSETFLAYLPQDSSNSSTERSHTVGDFIYLLNKRGIMASPQKRS